MNDSAKGGARDIATFQKVIADFETAWEAALSGGTPPDLNTFVSRMTPPHKRDQLRDQLTAIDARFRRGLPGAAITMGPTETVLLDEGPQKSQFADPSTTATIDPDRDSTANLQATIDTTPDDQPNDAESGGSGVAATMAPDASQNLAFTVDFSVDPAAVDSPVEQKPRSRKYPTVPGYEVLGELGRGGMGVVYRAKQLGLNRTVALKMILAGNHAAPHQLVRFRAEAEAVAQLQHANIVQVYDVGEQEGLPYFSLEFVGGGALDQLIKEKPLLPTRAAELVESIARAMHYAHQRNIVHRDLKPANILLTNEGEPKITDFGLVKRLEDEASQTRTGTVMGTPSYMAPEQARGDKEVGPLADVYSLGSILYCLLTGRPPFMAATAIDTVMQVLKEEPVPPRRMQPKIPVDLETVCLKCLQKEPGKRYASAVELADDLQRFLTGAPIQARPVGGPERVWRWCRRNPHIAIPTALAAVLALVLMIGGPAAAVVIYNISRAETKAKNEAEFHAKVAREEKTRAETSEQLALASAETANQQRNLALDTLRSLVERVQPLLQDTPKMQQVRQDLLNVALAGLSEVAERSDGVQDSSVLMAGARRRMGDLFLELGQTERAITEYKRCHQIVTRLAAENKLPNAEANLGTAHESLGIAAKRAGDLNEAKQQLVTALDYRRKFYKASPQSPRAKDDLAKTLGMLGSICVDLGQTDEALTYYNESLQLRQEDVAAHPGDERAEQELAGALSAVGELHLRMGQPDIAVTQLSDSIDLLRGIARNHPEDRSADWNLQLFEMRLASLKLMLGNPQEALDIFQTANSVLQTLSAEDPDNSRMKMHLSQSYYGLGIIHEELGAGQDAAAAYQQSLRLRRELLAKDANNSVKQVALMLSLARCGELEEATQLAQKLERDARDASMVYLAATGYAVCASVLSANPSVAADSADRAEQYATRAVVTLKKAGELGYQFSEEQRLDPDLRSLHGRADFAALFP